MAAWSAGLTKRLHVLVGHHGQIVMFAMLFYALVGCGDSGGSQVTGRVTHGGEPVQNGAVTFVPDFNPGGNGPPSRWGDVKAGQYRVRGLQPGKYTVTVSGIDVAAPETPGGTVAQLFPPASHSIEVTGSKMTFDVDVPKDGS